MIRNFVEMPFYKGAVIAASLFFIVASAFKFIWALLSGEDLAAVVANIGTADFLISNFIGAIVYGIIITFYYKWKAKKYQK